VVAAVQTHPVFGDVAKNHAVITTELRAAAAKGARLVVLPELCTTGCMFDDRAQAVALSEEIPTGPSSRLLQTLAAELDLHIVAGLAERDGDCVYNSAVLVGPQGHIGSYRKLHLWDHENTVLDPGDTGLPVFDTALGNIGMLICYDAWFPETFRSLALSGADVVCVSANWVPVPGQQPGRPAMALTLCQAAAHVNSIHVLAADRVGTEKGQDFNGQSVLVGPTGWPLVEPASATDPDRVFAETDLTSGRRIRRWNEFNDPIADRRPREYEALHEPATI
jgi:predicted amidohydrolase